MDPTAEVDGMSKLITNDVNMAQSSEFHVSGHKWRLVIYPSKKDRTETKDHLCFYLRISDRNSLPSNWEVKCSFKLSIVSQTKHVQDISKSFVECYNATEAIKGEYSFILHSVLERYIVNDKVVFCAEITEFKVEPKLLVTSIPRTMGTANRLNIMEMPRVNSRFTWNITQFSSFDGEQHSSYKFTVGPRQWNLVMYPKGKGEGKGKWLSLFLHASDYVTNGPKDSTFAIYKMRVFDQLQRKHYEVPGRDWFGYNASRGKTKFLPLEELYDQRRGLLVNDQIYISIEFLLVPTTEYL
ncbi:unnamed protein product [Microthlaspi erraticum]|uniref:MATH domain-containing protein n=1 Tax=Microthlaspi erraticum TaxID=1685480 RepID=A0A6D2IUL2_9BRAS|nr:unnamed protein product [Microthlaspi erraticum]